MKRILSKVLAVVLALAACTGCKSTGGETFHYVNLSQVLCTFLGEENQPLEITVKASPADYEVAPGASWLKAEKSEDGKTLTLTVEDNETGAERSTTVTVEAGQAVQQITVNQLAKDNEFARYRRLETFQSGAAISPNGKYVGGFVPSIAPDDSWQYSPTIIDMETGDVYEFGPYPEAVYYMTDNMCISDQGVLFIHDGSNGGMIIVDTEGNVTKLDAYEGYRGAPIIESVSADGRYWVGHAVKGRVGEDNAPCKALLWIDGVPHELPWPELNYRDEATWYGGMARGISANGEIIYGTSWENWDFGMLYWVNNGENTAAPKWVGHDVREVVPVTMKMGDGTEYETHLVKGCKCTAENTKVSPNGKWIATKYCEDSVSDDGISMYTSETPAFYNTETETTVIVNDYGSGSGTHVTDDGIAFIGLGSLGVTACMVYDLNTGTDLGSMADWVYDTYGIIIPGSGFISYVTPDGKSVIGSFPMASAGGVTYVSWYIAPPIGK